ncbi:hypothetical protein [Pseudomonas sp. FEN]|nr:hypothetical protein [Pseudomonas sp. FEN]
MVLLRHRLRCMKIFDLLNINPDASPPSPEIDECLEQGSRLKRAQYTNDAHSR